MAIIQELLRSRKRQTILVLVIVVVVFCFMQLLSLMRLNKFRDNQGQITETDFLVKEDQKVVQEEETNKEQKKIKEKEETRKNTIEEIDDRRREPELNIKKAKPSQLPRGVHVDNAERYAPNPGNMFRCISTGKEISMEMVNDEYCDCDDSSDEPGTSACPNSKFYCKYQIPYEDPQFLPGSQVNDGICDCCDGSDEWSGRVVPSHMHLSESQQRALVYQAPCRDRCQLIVEQIGEETKLRHRGAEIRKEYVQLAGELTLARRKRYGPDGAFYKLASTCFEFRTSEYVYTVCPFTSVKQQKGSKPSVSLGRNASWEKQRLGHYVLQMLDGDAKQCPLGSARKTKIFFVCGLEDKVVEVAEKEKCSYTVKFTSPAACA